MGTASKKPPCHFDSVMEYANSIVEGQKIACKMQILGCQRFLRDLKNPAYDFRPRKADMAINLIESTFVHKQAETLDGHTLVGKPFRLEPFHKFIVYNLLGFYHKGTELRRFQEAMIFIPRKNIKTTFSAALAWAVAMQSYQSGSKVYITAAAQKQSKESFDFLLYNLKRMGLDQEENFRIIDNNQEHSITGEFPDGSIFIQALASSVDRQDSLNCNFVIADEIHAYRDAKQYTILKEAMKAYANKLIVGITTAGDDATSFCYYQLEYCKSILRGKKETRQGQEEQAVSDEQYFVFICEADRDSTGFLDYTNPRIHEMANPAYGVSIRPDEILRDSIQAQNTPTLRKQFLAKSLNVYTSDSVAYFDLEEFRASDKQYCWTLKELAKLPIVWFGGTDLSRLHDLTAAALYGCYYNAYKDEAGEPHDVDIVITHCWFPEACALEKARDDHIPLYGWMDDGQLSLCKTPTVNYYDVVKWFVSMRKLGFHIRQVGHDKRFAKEYIIGMKRAKFKIEDQPQYAYLKTPGFRRIEQKAKNKDFYYLHSEPFEYCVQNVKAVETAGDVVQYSKSQEKRRIDVFDAAVFGCCRMLEYIEDKSERRIGAMLSSSDKPGI